MEIVTVKNKFQVVIPQALRKQLGVNLGDVLEANIEGGRLTYTPKMIIDRIPTGKAERERFFKQLRGEAPTSLKAVWATSERNGTDKITMREINEEVSKIRRARSCKTPKVGR